MEKLQTSSIGSVRKLETFRGGGGGEEGRLGGGWVFNCIKTFVVGFFFGVGDM